MGCKSSGKHPPHEEHSFTTETPLFKYETPRDLSLVRERYQKPACETCLCYSAVFELDFRSAAGVGEKDARHGENNQGLMMEGNFTARHRSRMGVSALVELRSLRDHARSIASEGTARISAGSDVAVRTGGLRISSGHQAKELTFMSRKGSLSVSSFASFLSMRIS
jgi:hypothetical protein